jgi:hypothetical protein
VSVYNVEWRSAGRLVSARVALHPHEVTLVAAVLEGARMHGTIREYDLQPAEGGIVIGADGRPVLAAGVLTAPLLRQVFIHEFQDEAEHSGTCMPLEAGADVERRP